MAQSTRLYLDQALETGLVIRLDGDEAQYLGRVLRLRAGDRISVFNGRDGEYAAELQVFTRKHVELVVDSRLVDPEDAGSESELRLHLVRALRAESVWILSSRKPPNSASSASRPY